MPPEEALGYLARIHSILIVHFPPPVEILRQKIYVHSLGFDDDANLRRGAEEIMAAFGFTPETFPAFAIQGHATIAEIIEYDSERFWQDRDAHGHKESLAEYQIRLMIAGQVWGVRLDDTYFFGVPILDVLPILNGSESFWQIDLAI